MKTILVLTDFSIRAGYAAKFATHMAIKAEANVLLCHAIEGTAAVTDGNGLDWPVPTHTVLTKECDHDLAEIVQKLEKLIKNDAGTFKPKVHCRSVIGSLAEIAAKIVLEKKVSLVVMGSHRTSLLGKVLTENHAHTIIDQLNCPVLILPESYSFKGIGSIAYATDLTFGNAKVISYLADIAVKFDALLSVDHITTSADGSAQFEIAERTFRTERALYPNRNIRFRNIKRNSVKNGLLEMVNYIQADILALVHKRYGFFEGLFHTSLSKKMVDIAPVPILILPHYFSQDVADLSEAQLESFCFETGNR
ncbi:MAG: universal stress protein [Mucilaginibacter sp.]|uniref:universal stress protein n=1 Tax=Mucilaginibacter sp. TaxID=1882438 RepID=UPI0032660104